MQIGIFNGQEIEEKNTLLPYLQFEAQVPGRGIGILASASTYIQNMGRRTGSSSGLRCPTDASLGSIT